jgi:hypothetical protein
MMSCTHALRGDAVLGVEGDLLPPAALGLVHGALHGAGDLVGVEDGLAVDVARGAADGLDQRGSERRKPSLSASRIATSAHLGHVEALAQQVDADQHVELAEAQVADDLHRSTVSMSECR